MQELTDANRIATPVTTEIIKSNDATNISKRLSLSEIIYDKNVTTSQLVLPSTVKTYDLQTSDPVTEIAYDKYDNNGNLLQYTLKPDASGNGTPVAIVWGYNKTQPIAKIEGATYSQVSQYISNIISYSDTNDETTLLSELDTFRKQSALAGFQITTYTYFPLIGVRTITPPSGIREYYIYDSANRLKEVHDVNGNILKEYQYHYKQ
jgi:hypothetical protein